MKKTTSILTGAFLLMMTTCSFSQFIPSDISWKISCLNITTSDTIIFTGGPNDLRSIDQTIANLSKGYDDRDIIFIKMKFYETPLTIEDTLLCSEAKHFWKNHNTLLGDCETNPFDKYQNKKCWNSLQTPYNSKTIVQKDDKIFLEGKSSYKMALDENDHSSNTIGLYREIKHPYIPLVKEENTYANIYIPTDAEHTWFFFYLYGNDNADSFFKLSVLENDTIDDRRWESFSYSIPLNFKGWKQFAIPYSNTSMQKNSPANKKRDTNNIISVGYILINHKSHYRASVNIDYMSILYTKR